MTGRAVIFVVLALSLTACGIETTDRTYNDSLIRQVGAGSVTEASMLSTLQSQAALPGNFNDPKLDPAMTALLKGELNKLSEHDYILIAGSLKRSYTRYPQYLALVHKLAKELREARLDSTAYRELSSGAKRFIADWNESLTGLASAFDAMRKSLVTVLPKLDNDFRTLLLVAAETTSQKAVPRFAQIRRRVLGEVFPLVEQLDALKQRYSSAGKALTDLIHKNGEAQVIVRKVNEQYPRGLLAQEYK
jgi:hypothetical protein